MIPFLALFLICLAGAIGAAFALNYYFQLGLARSLGLSLFAIAIIIIFAATGAAQGGSRHDWGILAPLFALLLICGWLALKFGACALAWWLNKKRGR